MNVIREVGLYVMSQGASDYYDGPKMGFGGDVAEAFPSAIYDIQEASRCRALERWTACVMHSMRALEPALLSLAAHMNATVVRKDWWPILKGIREEVERRKDEGLHAAMQFESEALSYFRDIKDGWRNHTMHAKMQFDEEGAVAVLRPPAR